MASVMTVANAVAVPSALNVATCRLRVDTTRQSPTTPLHVIIAAAKTVSRARLSVSDAPEAMSVTIEPGLDDRHGDGEDQGPERLAHAVRDDLRVVHGREDRACEHDRHRDEDGISRLPAPRRREREEGDDWNDEQPGHGADELACLLDCLAHRRESTARSRSPYSSGP